MTDAFDELEVKLRRAVRGADNVRPLRSSHGWRRSTMLALAAALLVSGAAIAATSLLSSGSPVPFQRGAPIAGRAQGAPIPVTVKLLADDIPDPGDGPRGGCATGRPTVSTRASRSAASTPGSSARSAPARCSTSCNSASPRARSEAASRSTATATPSRQSTPTPSVAPSRHRVPPASCGWGRRLVAQMAASHAAPPPTAPSTSACSGRTPRASPIGLVVRTTRRHRWAASAPTSWSRSASSP